MTAQDPAELLFHGILDGRPAMRHSEYAPLVTPRAGAGVWIALVLLVLTACGDASWREVASPDGGFRIRMRGDPRVEQRNVETPVGRITGNLYTLEAKDSVFG